MYIIIIFNYIYIIEANYIQMAVHRAFVTIFLFFIIVVWECVCGTVATNGLTVRP
jgi:hypothetical protein